jgi:hypothetical protein
MLLASYAGRDYGCSGLHDACRTRVLSDLHEPSRYEKK